MALSYDQLKALLEKPSYAKRTDAELQQAASDYYDPIYNTQTLSAQQQADTTNAAYDQQLSALGADYEKQRKSAAEQTAAAKYGADRSALTRGMGRSSYNNANLSLLDKAGNETLAGINSAEGTARQGIESSKALTTQQLAQTLAGLQTNKAKEMASYQNQLRDSDYEKELSALQYRNELEQMLANYQVDLEKYGLVSGGGRSGRSGGSGNSGSSSSINPLTDLVSKQTTSTPGASAGLYNLLKNQRASSTTNAAAFNKKTYKPAVIK